jgi:hypothetical protein
MTDKEKNDALFEALLKVAVTEALQNEINGGASFQ